MSRSSDDATMTVALIGNPNTGKSTVFSALSGVHQRVGNYPGVTVEKKIGTAVIGGRNIELVDLPGTYSLAPRSPDEMVARFARRIETPVLTDIRISFDGLEVSDLEPGRIPDLFAGPIGAALNKHELSPETIQALVVETEDRFRQTSKIYVLKHFIEHPEGNRML